MRQDTARADSHQSTSALRVLRFFLFDIGPKLSENQEKSFENVGRCGNARERSRAEKDGKGVGETEMGGQGG